MKKNILVVDDSALMRRIICDIINSDSNYQAKDYCRDGLEAYERLKVRRYDAVVLDVNMPKMTGLELLERIQKERIKATVVMVSTVTKKDADVTIRAMELGAVDFITKPENIVEAKGLVFKESLINVLAAVMKTGNVDRLFVPTPKPSLQSMKNIISRPRSNARNKLIALACSTGGPKALQSVIPFLPKNMDAPMILVQHMPAGFTKSMAERLDEISQVSVKEAEEGDVLRKGCVYIAPGGRHMLIVRTATGEHKVKLSSEPPIEGLRPCANLSYDSLAQSSFDEITCVVLTGMGADGTKGILKLKETKSIYVIAQDADTCVVYGMPKALANTGVVDEVVPLNSVTQAIIKNVGVL